MNDLKVICYREPCLMCGMAMVHSRVKRIIFKLPNDHFMGCFNEKVNLLQIGVNHKFEVF